MIKFLDMASDERIKVIDGIAPLISKLEGKDEFVRLAIQSSFFSIGNW